MAITLRNVKGSELTFEELDGNFTDLNGRVTTLEGGTGGLSNVVEDTSPELGGDLVTGTKRLKFSSAGGSMLDFTVTQYSVANNTVLSSVGSINLFLDSASADSSGDTAFRIFDTTDPDGAVTETNNIFKIADTGDISVKGNISVSGTNRIQLGAAQDLSIFHNGGHSIIRETGTGSLYLQSDDNVILSTDSSTKKMVKGVGGGEVILYHNDIQKLNTSTSGVTVVDEVHTEGATPHLTLKRTDNANVPTLRFKGQGGTIGASIDFDGTAGTSNELAFQVYDGVSIAERFRVTYTGAKVTGNLQVGVLDTDATITTQGTGDLTLSTNSGTNSGTIILRDGVNGDIILETDGTGDVLLKGNKVGIGSVNQPDTTLHLKDTNSVITLQRTADANTPGLSFQQSGGNVRAELKMDGTSGTANEVFIKTDNQDGQGLVERFRAGHTGVTIAGTLNGHTIPAGAGTLALLSDIGGGGATNMAGLTDVDSVDTVASGDFLLFDGSSSEYKFVAFQAEVNGLIDSRTGSSGHISTQSQYAGIITTDSADPTDTAHHILGNTGSASVHNASTGWYYGDVVSDPANPTTSVVLDIDQQRFTGAIQSDSISVGSGGGITAQAGATLDFQGTTINFGSAIIMGGNAFNGTINNHLWSGSTQPTNGYVLSWNTALLGGSGDYEWVSNAGSSNSISQGNSNVTVTDTGSDGTIIFDTEGTDRWAFTSAGHLLPYANAAYDIGSADYKVRHLFLSDNSLKFVDSSDTVHELSVASGFLQFKGKDLISSESTQNVNMNVNGAGLGISIGTASTSGTTISIGAEVNNTSVNMFGVTEFGAKAIFNRGVHEKFLTITGATGVVAHNVQSGHLFLHTTPAADWTANFTNFSLAQEDATNIAIVVNQGNTGYIPNAVQIDGVAQTIVWNGNSTPSATDNGTDVFSFTVLNDGGTYIVLGQMVSFGGV